MSTRNPMHQHSGFTNSLQGNTSASLLRWGNMCPSVQSSQWLERNRNCPSVCLSVSKTHGYSTHPALPTTNPNSLDWGRPSSPSWSALIHLPRREGKVNCSGHGAAVPVNQGARGPRVAGAGQVKHAAASWQQIQYPAFTPAAVCLTKMILTLQLRSKPNLSKG